MQFSQMTDTEREKHYMQGEFKPKINTFPVHPRHMTDTELEEALSKFRFNSSVFWVNLNAEWDKRGDAIAKDSFQRLTKRIYK
jgi:hypothetical protein